MSAEPVVRSAPDREYAAVGTALFWLCGLVLIIPVWMGLHFPNEDGFAHLHWTDVYRALGTAGSPWAAYYERSIQWNTPNLSYFALQYALSAVVEPHAAQKIAITLLILSWIAAVHFLSMSIGGRLTIGAFGSLLLILSSWLYGGYLGFLVGVPIVLVSLGLIVKIVTSPAAASRSRTGWYVALALLGIVGFYSHFVVAGLFLLLVLLAIVFYGRSLPARALPLAIVALPTGVLSLSYVLAGRAMGPGSLRWEPIRKTVARFVGFAFFRGFARADAGFWIALTLLGAIFVILCAGALRAWRRGQLPPLNRFLLFVAVCLAVVYFVSPDGVGQGYNLKGRVQLAMWACLLPSLPYGMSRRVGQAMVAGICVLLAWQIGDFSLRARRFNAQYARVLETARTLPPGATLTSALLYENASFEGSFIRVLAHSPEDIAYHCRCVLVEGYHPSTAFYWVRIRPGASKTASYALNYEQQRPGSVLSLVIGSVNAAASQVR